MERDLHVGDQSYRFQPLMSPGVGGDVSTLPFSLKVVLENLLRHRDGESITDDDVAVLAAWDPRIRGRGSCRSRRRGSCSRTSPVCRSSW